ncbi:MAG: hypothetical protein WCO00_13385 [Rhodospirillaceae bacterium]
MAHLNDWDVVIASLGALVFLVSLASLADFAIAHYLSIRGHTPEA